eukprot:GILK01011832.1.p2 GENE.GILK01011832.1~~GILK01011832.1.p2  ORF type:complete len:106 (+),score=6.92 GILK01011832.1:97-414(+)
MTESLRMHDDISLRLRKNAHALSYTHCLPPQDGDMPNGSLMSTQLKPIFFNAAWQTEGDQDGSATFLSYSLQYSSHVFTSAVRNDLAEGEYEPWHPGLRRASLSA